MYGKELNDELYHVRLVQTHLTRNLEQLSSDIVDEMQNSIKDLIHVNEQDWTSFNALDFVMHAVCRTTNRVFVGPVLCRNPEWIKLNERFTLDVLKIAHILNLTPSILRQYVLVFSTA